MAPHIETTPMSKPDAYTDLFSPVMEEHAANKDEDTSEEDHKVNRIYYFNQQYTFTCECPKLDKV